VLGTTEIGGTVTSPLTITSTGAVEASSGDAIYGNGSAAWTVVNSGTVETTGTTGSGINLRAGGSVDNTGTGLIDGYRGVYILGTAGTVTNSGTILGTASYGVRLLAGGTVVDSGTISGASGTAVYFGGIGSNLLALQSGYQLSGLVVGSTAGTDMLELLGTAGRAVTADYNALGLTSFENVLFGTGGNATLLVSNVGIGITLGLRSDHRDHRPDRDRQ
jgi:hypothetical protein